MNLKQMLSTFMMVSTLVFAREIYLDSATRNYVKNNLELIIKDQEKKLNIKHIGRPTIDYGIPSRNADMSKMLLGLYDDDQDKIYIHTRNVVAKDNDSFSKFTYLTSTRDDVKSVLDHELGHYYLDKLNEKLSNSNWQDMDNIEKFVFRKLVGEGIATYFEAKMNKTEYKRRISDWHDVEKLSQRDLYDLGYNLVEPILDKYGALGMEKLVLSPMTTEEITNLKKYQDRILFELSNSKLVELK